MATGAALYYKSLFKRRVSFKENFCMSLTDLFAPVYSCKGISKFKLEEKAVKVLQKFIEQLNTYLSLSAAKRNFKSITSQDMFIIVSELERIGYLIGKID